MASLNPPRNFFGPELLAAMEQAFDATWAVIQAHQPALDRDRAKELSTDISRKIVAFAAEGVTDPVELRRLALETLPEASMLGDPKQCWEKARHFADLATRAPDAHVAENFLALARTWDALATKLERGEQRFSAWRDRPPTIPR